MKRFLKIVLILALPLALSTVAAAQTKRPKKTTAKATKPVQTATRAETPPDPVVDTSQKHNRRPAETRDAEPHASSVKTAEPSAYSYEFTRPGFGYSRILIEHDEKGKGKISFLKDGFDEMLTDPVALSPVTLAKIADALTALSFLSSTEENKH